MVLTLSGELEDLIRRKLRTGNYDSPTQVVEEGLLLLEERDQVLAVRRERLLRELANGVFQANNRELIDSAQVFAGLRNQESAVSE
jgi:antitoxin ParD1/3/4